MIVSVYGRRWRLGPSFTTSSIVDTTIEWLYGIRQSALELVQRSNFQNDIFAPNVDFSIS